MEEEEVTGGGGQPADGSSGGGIENWPDDDEGEEVPLRVREVNPLESGSYLVAPPTAAGGVKRRPYAGLTGGKLKKLKVLAAATKRQEAAAKAVLPRVPKPRPAVSG